MYKRFGKRTLDITLALFLLIITLPITLVIALVIKLESKGPILFTQQRTGIHGDNFILLKFRSMTIGNDVRDLTKGNELTRIGKFLRAFSLDEIPQCINIFSGDMSFIGPRPWITEYYKHMNEQQRHRVDVRPGISGLAQVRGRNSLTINAKINYDLEYVARISFKEDIKIILLTIEKIFDKAGQEIDKYGIEGELSVLREQDSGMVGKAGVS